MAVPIKVTNDSESAEALFQTYAPEIRRVLLNRGGDDNSVDDVMQTTYLKLNDHFDSLDPRAIRAWLYRVAINLVNMQGRKKKLDDKAWKHLVETGSFQCESPETTVLRHERIEQTRKILERLPGNQRQIVRLKFYEGLTFAEIAKQTATPLGTVLSRMRAAMKQLEQLSDQQQLRED